MGDFTLIITNEQGGPLNGVLVQDGVYNTSPCPAWPNQGDCVPSPGGEWEGTSGSDGKIVTQIGARCKVEYTGNLYADGYDKYPFSSGNLDAATGGNFTISVQMVESSPSGGAPQNQGDNASAGDTADQVAATVQGAKGPGATDLTTWITTNWWVILLFGIIVIGVIVAVGYGHKSGAPAAGGD